MGKISEVFYKEIDPKICDEKEASSFYYHYNLLGLNEKIDEEYEQYEMKQMEIKNKIIGDCLKQGEFPRYPNISSTIFGISSMKNRTILIMEC